MAENRDDSKPSQSPKKPAVFKLDFENWDSFTHAQRLEWISQLHTAIVDELTEDDSEVTE